MNEKNSLFNLMQKYNKNNFVVRNVIIKGYIFVIF